MGKAVEGTVQGGLLENQGLGQSRSEGDCTARL